MWYSNALHLVVTDVLYNKNTSSLETDLNPISENSENDESNNDLEKSYLPIPELLDNYKILFVK